MSLGETFGAEGKILSVFLLADKNLRATSADGEGGKREDDAEKEQKGPFRKDVVAYSHNGDARREEK